MMSVPSEASPPPLARAVGTSKPSDQKWGPTNCGQFFVSEWAPWRDPVSGARAERERERERKRDDEGRMGNNATLHPLFVLQVGLHYKPLHYMCPRMYAACTRFCRCSALVVFVNCYVACLNIWPFAPVNHQRLEARLSEASHTFSVVSPKAAAKLPRCRCMQNDKELRSPPAGQTRAGCGDQRR